jgi:hemolysin-activating ACP:hemolysin acyltransferase
MNWRRNYKKYFEEIMEIPIYTVTLALFAMQRDIKFHEQECANPVLSDEDRDGHGQYVLDLTQAFGEMRMIYQDLVRQHPEMSPIEELDQQIARYC